MDNYRLFAHRGASYYAPENTIAALKLAKTLGASWVEFDVQLTADQIAVVFHDDDLTRIGQHYHDNHWQNITDQRNLFEIPWRELKNINVGMWFQQINPEAAAHLDLTTIHMASLEEYLTIAKQLDFCINIELKLPEKLYLPENKNLLIQYRQNLLQTVLDIAQKLNWSSENIILSSFDLPIIQMAYKTAPAYPRAALYWGKWPKDNFQFVLDYQCQAANLQAEMLYHLKQPAFDTLKNHQIPINIYTVNTKQRACELIEIAKHHGYQLHGFFTDDFKTLNEPLP